MRKYIGDVFASNLDHWARNDPRQVRLAELDAHLDGTFYDALPYPFYQETSTNTAKGKYIPIMRRRPSFRFNVYNMIAVQMARKIFAGRHAPSLVHDNEKTRKSLDALKEECELEAKMIEACKWGSIGSVATIFEIVPFTTLDKKKRSKVVVRNIRARNCTPKFNEVQELSRLRLHWVLSGADYLEYGSALDYEGKPIKPNNQYWFIRDLTEKDEITYAPIKAEQWAPANGDIVGNDKKPKKLTDFATVTTPHDLGFVPAHWHQYGTGSVRPYDGVCYWEPAIPNIIDIDYTVSTVGSGIRYNSIPQVVVKGNLVNQEQDGGLARGAARWIQVAADLKEGDFEEKSAEVYMLEAKGAGMQVGLEWWAPLSLRTAFQQICASLKDPNKVSTAMSGKGMEIIESESHDLAHELRTIYGDNGFLKLLKKIAVACVIKGHSLMAGITAEQVDGLRFGWPPLTSITAQELDFMARGLALMMDKDLLTKAEARAYGTSQIDMPVNSMNKDYLPTVQTIAIDRSKTKVRKIKAKKTALNNDEDAEAVDANSKALGKKAVQQIARGPLDTRLPEVPAK